MRVEVALRDGTVRTLSDKALERAARNSPTASGSVRTVNVSGADYDLLPLIERALGVSAGDVAFPAAIEAAVNAGLIPEQQAPTSSRSDQSPSLKSRLYRLRGNWVAVDGDSVLAHNADLETLMTMVVDRDATVFYVPTDDRWPR